MNNPTIPYISIGLLCKSRRRKTMDDKGIGYHWLAFVCEVVSTASLMTLSPANGGAIFALS